MIAVATGIEKLDEELQRKFSEAGHECRAIYFRDFLIKSDEKVVILSPKLEGTVGFDKLLYELRRQNKRVILLLDKRDKKRIRYAIALGIYDIIHDPVTSELLLEIYNHPRTFSDVAANFQLEGENITEAIEETFTAEMTEAGKEESKRTAEDDGRGSFEERRQEKPEESPNRAKQLLKLPELPKVDRGSIIRKNKAAGADYRARLWLVIGSSPNCGATTLATVLAQKLSEKRNVRLIDAGGGISRNISNLDMEVAVYNENESPVVPGILTIADIGYVGGEECLLPFAEAAIIVTDGSEESAEKVKPIVPGRTYLVGMRGTTEEELFTIALLKKVTPAVVLPDIAMKSRQSRIPQAWNKPLIKLIRILEEADSNA